MSEETPNSVTVPPSVPILGGLKVTGSTAILAIMLAGAMYWIYDQNQLRSRQFELLACKVDLAIYAHSFPKGAIDWSLLPADMYACIPNFKIK